MKNGQGRYAKEDECGAVGRLVMKQRRGRLCTPGLCYCAARVSEQKAVDKSCVIPLVVRDGLEMGVAGLE